MPKTPHTSCNGEGGGDVGEEGPRGTSNVVCSHFTLTGPEPYGDCTDGKLWEAKYGYRYHPETCLSQCQIANMIKQCNCKIPLQVFADSPMYNHIKYYLHLEKDSTDMQQINDKRKCMYSFWWSFEHNKTVHDKLCNCSPRCSDLEYPFVISSSKWPAHTYYETFAKSLLNDETEMVTTKPFTFLQHFEDFYNSDMKWSNFHLITDNFARVNIYLEDSQLESKYQERSYPLSNLFSDIGGTLGLWIGLSLLTVVEVVQLILRLAMAALGKQYTK